MSHDWISSGSWSFDEDAKKRMEAVMQCVVGDSLLDVGCRDGTFSLTYAREHPDVKVVGFDTDASAVDFANLQAIAHGLDNATYFQVSIFDSFGPTTLGSFSTVVCMETLEHLPQNRVQEANDMLLRYTKKRSRLIITVPANRHISDEDHKRLFYREELHGRVTWIDVPFLWLGYYVDSEG